MAETLKNWTARPKPERVVLQGRLCRLEPLDPARHGDDLYADASAASASDRMRYLFEKPPESREAFSAWLEKAVSSGDPLFFAVVDEADGKARGRMALMRIDVGNGVIEVGSIFWGASMMQRPIATEAIYLAARHAFDDLGYRRFEWKCDDRNAPSRRAATRLGFSFEGIFRQHMVVKGESRDTAWYAMLDTDWPARKAAFEAWLDPSNFDADGRQKRRLENIAADMA